MRFYTPYLELLSALQQRIRSKLLDEHDLHCEVGEWLDCAVLKLQKKTWTKNGLGEGVFFSVWIGEKELKRNRFNYNIHAYKLRLWKDHEIKPVEFASSFRSRVRSLAGSWPNLEMDYGPQTLMQGWLDLSAETFERDVSDLIEKFVGIQGIVDEMLQERKKAGPGFGGSSSRLSRSV